MANSAWQLLMGVAGRTDPLYLMSVDRWPNVGGWYRQEVGSRHWVPAEGQVGSRVPTSSLRGLTVTAVVPMHVCSLSLCLCLQVHSCLAASTLVPS